MSKYLFVFVLIFSSCIYQNDNILSIETINEISILQFTSCESVEKIIELKNRKKLREILYIALLATTNNISNHNTTRTEIPNTPYKYQYIFINELLTWTIMEKESYKYLYDPLHPDAIVMGEKKGFVKYPEINLLEQEYNLTKIINILFSINK